MGDAARRMSLGNMPIQQALSASDIALCPQVVCDCGSTVFTTERFEIKRVPMTLSKTGKPGIILNKVICCAKCGRILDIDERTNQVGFEGNRFGAKDQ